MGYRKSDLTGLKEEIKKLADEGRSLGATVRSLRGPERHAARQEKAGVGYVARMALLAYALLRGAPYSGLEARTRHGVDRRDRLRMAGFVREHRPDPLSEEEADLIIRGWVSGEASP